MATINHKDIPDGERHEPKGVSTATAGQVYVASGSGSGVWTNPDSLLTEGIEIPDTKAIDLLGTSYLKTDSGDGWRDIVTSVTISGSGANDPLWEAITGASTMFAYSFSASTRNEFWCAFHINHDYAIGTPVYPHIHWFNAAASPNTGNVRWGIEYVVAKGHNQQAFPLTATTIVYVTQACPATRYQHMVAEVSLADSIPATNLEPDSIIYARIFRDAADGGDTCSDKVYVLAVDAHYQANTFATKNKVPNFYG
jgi:hypothetical protein